MKPQVDRILEGVRPTEVAQLQALAAGQLSLAHLGSLEGKGLGRNRCRHHADHLDRPHAARWRSG
ncbi:hypothetical protein [Devosia riboflavina]